MKTFNVYIKEDNIDKMTQDNKDLLNGYLEGKDKKDIDRDIEKKIMKAAELVVKKDFNKNNALHNYCCSKNFDFGNEKKIGRLLSEVIDIFSENDSLPAFDTLLQDANKNIDDKLTKDNGLGKGDFGFFSIKDLKDNSNIYDLMSNIKKEVVSDFFNIAIKDSDETGSADKGKGEFLLISLMKNAFRPKGGGDVAYMSDSKVKSLEVKGEQSIPKGQSNEKITVFYDEFFKEFNKESGNDINYKKLSSELFQKQSSEKEYIDYFKKFLKDDNKNNVEKLAKMIIHAAAVQYNIKQDITDKLYKGNKKFIDKILKEDIFTGMLNIMGCCQLYFYYLGNKSQPHFDEFIIFNSKGDYWITDFQQNDLFNSMCDKITFDPVGKSNTDRNKAAKMTLK